MKFTIERKRLLDACKKVMKVTASSANNVLPELSGILLEADADNRVIKLTGTDLTVSMMMKLKDVDVTDSGAIVIPASLFTGMLGAMTDETAAVMVNETALMLQCGNPIFHMTVMNAENFPAVAIAYPDNTVCVSGLTLITKQTAASTEKTDNPSYNGVQVRFSPAQTTAVSTDGVRFMKSKGDNIADGQLDVFIPERSLKLVCGMVKEKDDVYIGKTDRCAIFMTETFVFTTRLTDGSLSNVENLIEKVAPKYKAEVDAKEFYQAVDSCMVMVYNVDSCVNLTITAKALVLSVINENGNLEACVSVQSATDMEGKIFHYNPKLILDFIKSCSGTVSVEITETGILKLISGITVYIISGRRPAKIKEKKPAENTDKTETTVKSKTKKGKTAKKVAA